MAKRNYRKEEEFTSIEDLKREISKAYKNEAAIEKKFKKRRRILLSTVLVIGLVFIYVILSSSMFTNENVYLPTGSTGGTLRSSYTTPAAQPYNPEIETVPNVDAGGKELVKDDAFYIWNGNAFLNFKGTDTSALNYASTISSFKETLGGSINVYNMVLPTHTEFGLPKEYQLQIDTNSQRDNMTIIYSNFTQPILTVDVYNSYVRNMDDYLFYSTDSRTTATTGYHLYSEFAKVAGFEPISITDTTRLFVDNFYGDLAHASMNDILLRTPDYIEYFDLPQDISCTIYDNDINGNLSTKGMEVEMYNENANQTDDYYSTFLNGSYPLTVLDNNENSTGAKILLVHDGLGSTIAPFLATNYDEIHVVDFRTCTENIKEYCAENGITNVLFLNGIMSANSATQIDKMKSLF